MKQLTIIASSLLALAITSAHACKDDWQPRPDKQRHFAGSVAMAGVCSTATGEPVACAIASTAVGAAVEWRDSTMTKTGHCASMQDFGYDVAGSVLGAYLGNALRGLVITPRSVSYSVTMNLF